MLRLSRGERRRAQRHAAEEYFRRRNRPEPNIQELGVAAPAAPAPAPTHEPATRVITDWRESQQVLKKLLAEGQIKQSR